MGESGKTVSVNTSGVSPRSLRPWDYCASNYGVGVGPDADNLWYLDLMKSRHRTGLPVPVNPAHPSPNAMPELNSHCAKEITVRVKLSLSQ
jgi:hypothetical protein